MRARDLGAYGAAACSALYGSMKLAQALGATALADKDPLPPQLRDRLLARDPMFVASHWLLACAAVVGVILALSTLRPRGRPVRALTVTLAAFMIARAVGLLGWGFFGDTLVLTGVREASALHAELSRWDLLLWSPFFLIWGTCWALLTSRTLEVVD